MNDYIPTQTKSLGQILKRFEIPLKRKGKPTSERSDLLQQIADTTGIDFKLLLRETFHLKDSWGCDILRMILSDSLTYSEKKEWRRWKCADLIRKSKTFEEMKNKFEVGQYVVVVLRHLPFWQRTLTLIGMEGVIYNIHREQTPYEKELNITPTKYEVRAINYGKKIITDEKEKNIFQWKPGEHATFYAWELSKLEVIHTPIDASGVYNNGGTEQLF